MAEVDAGRWTKGYYSKMAKVDAGRWTKGYYSKMVKVDASRWTKGYFSKMAKVDAGRWTKNYYSKMAKVDAGRWTKANHLFVSVSYPCNKKNIAKSMTILKLCERSFKRELSGCPDSNRLEMA